MPITSKQLLEMSDEELDEKIDSLGALTQEGVSTYLEERRQRDLLGKLTAILAELRKDRSS